MIISASRRTDIPSHYADWFMGRVRAGFVEVRNPRNAKQARRVSLLTDDVDGIVFWTKNPAPMLPHLAELSAYAHYFQVTLTPYGPDVEPGYPEKEAQVVPAMLALSDRIGPERVVWRYDPILLSGAYTKEFHFDAFERLARRLSGRVARCTLSFLDMYRNTARSAAELGLRPIETADMMEMAERLSQVARGFGISLAACAEVEDFSRFGIARARCVDPGILEAASGRAVKFRRDRNQRPACGCAESVDIGAYNTCPGGCKYCYANYSPALLRENLARHSPDSSLISGAPEGASPSW